MSKMKPLSIKLTGNSWNYFNILFSRTWITNDTKKFTLYYQDNFEDKYETGLLNFYENNLNLY